MCFYEVSLEIMARDFTSRYLNIEQYILAMPELLGALCSELEHDQQFLKKNTLSL